MSTRRARIKAVAALPPRRKNIENDNKSKANSVKDDAEASLKSPRTPRSQIPKNDEKNSPAVKSKTRSPPGLIPINTVSTPVLEQLPSPTRVDIPEESKGNTEIPEKVPVITPVPAIKNVFASPQFKSSPRRVASPLMPPSTKPPKNVEASATLLPLNVLDDVDKVAILNASQSNENDSNKGDNKSVLPDDYSVPSVPESITEDAVVDGIVQLQSARHAPKPIDLLKNEIISEYADVSFDPIVPLPSPSKVRPKLRPVPRLAPHRRNSIQGSASESEDESRRALLGGGPPTPAPPRQRHDSHTSHSTLQSQVTVNKEMTRIRNDSVCSSVSQVAVTQPPPATSPVKEKHFSKTRRHEMNRRSWLRRREVKRDALTMYDLIFYNPTTNPIIPDQDEIKANEANAKEQAERSAKEAESEEDADDPPASDAAPVPQIKIGPNGEIVLDEKSLVIKQSDTRKVSSVVREGSWGGGSGRYSRAARTAEWSAAETVRFYRALGAVGTDFSLMAPLFPDRNRRDLYLKFKKEERINGAQVDKALRSATAWDVTGLQDEFKQEREEAERRAEDDQRQFLENKKAERARIKSYKETRLRNSRSAKALEFTVKRGIANTEFTADDFADQAIAAAQAQINRQINKTLRKQGADQFALPKAKEAVPFATLTLLQNSSAQQKSNPDANHLATLSQVAAPEASPNPICLNEIAGVPSNIENGSLVVLRVNDPKSPTKTMLQTYIAHGAGKLTPVALPSTFLNSVVGYMKKGTPKSTMSSASSPQLTSPSSIASQDSRSCTPSVIQLNPSPAKKKRHTSFTITSL